jgi:hypothetical protein
MGEHKNNPNVLKFQNQMAKPGQIQIDPSQVEKKACPCGHEFFEKVFRLGTISKLAPGNPINQDITVEYPTYICKGCGLEFGKANEIIKQ